MSPASYLAAPPRVAAEIVAPRLRSARGLDDLRRPHPGVSRDRRGIRPPLRPRARDVAVARSPARQPRGRARASRGSLREGVACRRARRRPAASERQPRTPSGLARAVRRPPVGVRGSDERIRPHHRGRAAEVRVAALDLGTNTTRLLVADVVDGNMEDVHRESQITRLGEGVDTRKRLLPVSMTRVRNVLAEYRRTLEELGAERALLVATSAVRDAENGEAFLGEIEWSYGFTTRLVSGDEEAQLTRRGVQPKPGTLVLDIGGGSTEVLLDDFHVSTDIGSVRFTARFIHTDRPTGEELDAAAGAVREALALYALGPKQAIGVAGTLTTLAALDLDGDVTRVHGYRLSLDAARAQLQRLASLPLEERAELPGLEPKRAPVIVAGAIILTETLAHLALDTIEISERDILDGIALAAAELPERTEGDAPPGAYTCC